MPTMGPLELAAMEVLWSRPDDFLRVRDVSDKLDADLAYTTVMTLLVRLHAKGLLDRRRRGRAWTYQPRLSRSEYAAQSMTEALQRGDDVSDVLFRFVEHLSAAEQQALKSLLEER